MKFCHFCSEEFEPTHEKVVFCSVACNKLDRLRRKREEYKSMRTVFKKNKSLEDLNTNDVSDWLDYS